MSQLEPFQVPDAFGYITAARAWLVWQTVGEAHRLKSVARPTVWQPKQRLEAQCLDPIARSIQEALTAPATHPSPQAKCMCGIWGLSSGDQVVRQYRNDLHLWGPWQRVFGHLGHTAAIYVYGVIAMWGRMVIGTQGWRAQFAYPQALIAGLEHGPRIDTLEQLSAAYTVPLIEGWPALTEIEPAP